MTGDAWGLLQVWGVIILTEVGYGLRVGKKVTGYELRVTSYGLRVGFDRQKETFVYINLLKLYSR